MSRETLLDALEAVRDQRDNLYCASVLPRRETERAIVALDAGDVKLAREHIEDACRGLFALGDLYREQTNREKDD